VFNRCEGDLPNEIARRKVGRKLQLRSRHVGEKRVWFIASGVNIVKIRLYNGGTAAGKWVQQNKPAELTFFSLNANALRNEFRREASYEVVPTMDRVPSRSQICGKLVYGCQ
jgi:hypothetical protein